MRGANFLSQSPTGKRSMVKKRQLLRAYWVRSECGSVNGARIKLNENIYFKVYFFSSGKILSSENILLEVWFIVPYVPLCFLLLNG